MDIIEITEHIYNSSVTYTNVVFDSRTQSEKGILQP